MPTPEAELYGIGPDETARADKFRTITIPRSGNILFLRCLAAYYNPKETDPYSLPFSGDYAIPTFGSRAHDLTLVEPLSEAGTLTIVQFREPERQLASYWTRAELNKAGTISSLDHDAKRRFAAKHAAYVVAFCRKWTSTSRGDRLLLPYGEFAANPTDVISRVIGLTDPAPVDMTRVRDAVAKTTAVTLRAGVLRPFVADHDVADYVDRRVLALYGGYVRLQTPWLAWAESDLAADAPTEMERRSFFGEAEGHRLRLYPFIS